MPAKYTNAFERTVAITTILATLAETLHSAFTYGSSFLAPKLLQSASDTLAELRDVDERLFIVDPKIKKSPVERVADTINSLVQGLQEELLQAGAAKSQLKKTLAAFKDEAIAITSEPAPDARNKPGSAPSAPAADVSDIAAQERRIMNAVTTKGVYMGPAPMIPIVQFIPGKLSALNIAHKDFHGYTLLPDQLVLAVSMDYVDKKLLEIGDDVTKMKPAAVKEARNEYLADLVALYKKRHPGSNQVGPTLYHRGVAFFWMPTAAVIKLLAAATFGGHLAPREVTLAFIQGKPVYHYG